MGKLDGKVALVTGSSRGIGKAIAMKFASEGADIVLNGFGGQKELKDAEKSVKQFGGGVIGFLGDVSKPDFVKKMVDGAVKRFGKIDILVNNVGIYNRHTLEECSLKDWEKTIATNLTSAFLLCKEVAPIMKKSNFGRIVNISSIAGIVGSSHGPDYAASKAALVALTKSLSADLGKFNIRVNSISPSYVNTDMLKYWSKEKIKEKSNEMVLGRVAEPEEIANIVLFLASEDSSIMTGENIVVGGGKK